MEWKENNCKEIGHQIIEETGIYEWTIKERKII